MARLVETLNDMLARIEQSFEAQRRFTADASHELRSPLSRLRAELEVTLRRPRERARYEEALRSCLSEVERLSRMTDELLMLARLDAGGPPEALRPVDLTAILHEAGKRLAPEALRRNVALVMDIPSELAVNVSPAALSHVVANLLDNAVKFSPLGSEVRVGVAIEGSAVVVAVTDTGPGIPEDEIPQLFERFFRGSAARHMEAPGVGLGLAICRALVEGQGGKISVNSARGSGATFRIWLPLVS
jgi:two-component system OmpR family sensor kinase